MPAPSGVMRAAGGKTIGALDDFPEFGVRTYRPPTGAAMVFSCSLPDEAPTV